MRVEENKYYYLVRFWNSRKPRERKQNVPNHLESNNDLWSSLERGSCRPTMSSKVHCEPTTDREASFSTLQFANLFIYKARNGSGDPIFTSTYYTSLLVLLPDRLSRFLPSTRLVQIKRGLAKPALLALRPSDSDHLLLPA